ncbi:MAG: hypothetical protein IJI67_09690 [Clostridia bacterium]|nr:hypothetical protein [Clostridia bacterium]
MQSYLKVLKLIKVLQKCNSKSAVGDSKALISPKAAKILVAVLLGLLCAVLFVIAYFCAPFVQPYVPLKALTQTTMVVILAMSFMLSIKNLVNVLYAADDLSVLLPLPFSAGQIVLAKLAVASRFPLLLSLALMNVVCLSFGVRLGGGAAFIIGTLLASVLLPVSGIALATLLVVIIFKVFGFIRNRDVTVILGGIFTLVLMIAYSFISAKLRKGDSSQAAAAAVTAISSVAAGFPHVKHLCAFMFENSIAGLGIGLGITAAVVILAVLAVKAFYLSTALSMQNTGTNKKLVTKESLVGNKHTGVLKALTAYEARSAKRNPAYLIYGFAMTFAWPILVVLPLIFGGGFSLQKISAPLGLPNAFFAFSAAGFAASAFACGFNVLPCSAFSREGANYEMLRTMPIAFENYYKSKRNFSLLICSLGSVVYIVIIGIVGMCMGYISPAHSWTILFSALLCFLSNSILINAMLLKNAKKANFNWDSESEISRKLGFINLIAILFGTVMFVACFIVLAIPLPGDAAAMIVGIAAAGILALTALCAFLTNRRAIKKAEVKLMQYE